MDSIFTFEDNSRYINVIPINISLINSQLHQVIPGTNWNDSLNSHLAILTGNYSWF